MPRRDKINAVILLMIFLVALSQFIIKNARFPARFEKDVFVEGVIGHVNNINPLFVDFNDADRDISQLIFSGLVRFDPAKKNFFNDLAASIERNSDGRIYTVTMRTDAVWHDGTPVTADDVYFTFKEVIQDPGFRNPILKNTFESVMVDRIGPGTITFTLPKPNSYFISQLTVGILPKHILAETPIATLDAAAFGKKPIGSGPYRLASLKISSDGDTADLEAFPQFYGSKPSIDKLRIYTFSDEETLAEERSALHGLSRLTAAYVKDVAQDERFTINSYTLNQFTALYLNTQNPFLKDKNVRIALLRGLNRDTLLFPGERRVDDLNLRHRPADSQFNVDATALDIAGLVKGSDGIRKNNKGEPFNLKILILNTQTSVKRASAIESQLKALGINATVEKAKNDDFYKLVSERQYDALLINQHLGYNRDVYSLFHSSQAKKSDGAPPGLNFSNFVSFQTDGLTEAMRREKNPAAKEKLLQQLSDVIAQEAPVIFISTPVYSYALDKRVAGWPTDSLDFHSDRLIIIPYLRPSRSSANN